MTQVTVLQPHGDAVLTAATPLRVTGRATGKGGFEPDEVDTVTVSFDGGPPVDASLTVVPKQKIPAVLFAMSGFPVRRGRTRSASWPPPPAPPGRPPVSA
jgi:hypothetical protein